jgi:hypothetical protein
MEVGTLLRAIKTAVIQPGVLLSIQPNPSGGRLWPLLSPFPQVR